MRTSPFQVYQCPAVATPVAEDRGQRTEDGTRNTEHGTRSTLHAFTLIELLVVIAIIAMVAALAAPVLQSFRPNVMAAASRQLLDDVARARQLAISHHTTVYMVFVPTNFWGGLLAVDRPNATNLLDKQLTGYTFVSLRSVGDQPGRHQTNYLGSWKTLPEGTFITERKFAMPTVKNPAPSFAVFTNSTAGGQGFYPPRVKCFLRTPGIPFPTETNSVSLNLPYIAFDYLGRLTDGTNTLSSDELIPLAKGGISVPRDQATQLPIPGRPPTVNEMPPGNATNAFNLVHISWLTGRARIERQEVQ